MNSLERNWTVKVLIQTFYHLFMFKINCVRFEKDVWKIEMIVFSQSTLRWERKYTNGVDIRLLLESTVWFDDSVDTVFFRFITMQFNGLCTRLPPSVENGIFFALRVHPAGWHCQLDKAHIKIHSVCVQANAYIEISVVHIQPHFMQSARDVDRGVRLSIIIIVLFLSSRSITPIAVFSVSFFCYCRNLSTCDYM